MKGSVPYTGSILSVTHQCLENWYAAKGKIQKHFQGCLCLYCVRWVCFLRKSTEFHDMRMECQRKIILIHFLLYSLFQPFPDNLRPNLLAHQSLAPQSLASWLLALQHSLPYCSFPPITCSLIACLLRPTRSLVFCCPSFCLISWSLFLWFSKITPSKADDSNINGSHQEDALYDRVAGSCLWWVLQIRLIPKIEIYPVKEKVGRVGFLEKTLRSPIA